MGLLDIVLLTRNGALDLILPCEAYGSRYDTVRDAKNAAAHMSVIVYTGLKSAACRATLHLTLNVVLSPVLP